ncbi:hypothetical protein BJY00DRAFT_315559 [Aspergillus carlsbadensis]|nr:hypothetical protein BJY00DRAFT_315559 [Aspergillus carlsbadensis]
MATISEIVQRSLTKLSDLAASEVLAQLTDEVPIHKWTDELGRLRVWAANIGAHQNGQSSLDYRLRDASHIRQQTVEVLRGLERLLTDLDELLHQPAMETPPSLEEQSLGLYDEMEAELQGESEVQEIYTSLVHIVSNLYQLSMIIRRPAPHDRLVFTNEEDARFFKPWATQHVSHKFPLLDNFLIDRLSTAMSKQKAMLKYRERHHEKLSWGLNDSKSQSQPSETIATRYYDADQSDNLSQGSATSYAPSLFGGEGSRKVPVPPEESANRNPFECQYCYCMITIKDRHDWARHVFHDLMPYTCIYSNCSSPTRLYGSRRQWYNHVSTAHAPLGATDICFRCVLCGEDDILARTFERHVGRHLEDLALFVLPCSMDYDSIEETNDEIVDDGGVDILSKGGQADSLPPAETAIFELVEADLLFPELPTAPATTITNTYHPFRCMWDGCTSPTIFHNESDLARHLKTVHISPVAYPCPVQECSRAFGRNDHLVAHLRRVHKHRPDLPI